MHKSLTILIFDGSFKTTPFINRLIRGLSKQHTIYILGFNETIAHPIPHVHYVSLGSNQNRFRLLHTTFSRLLISKKYSLLIPTFTRLLRGERKVLQQQNLRLALNTIHPDVIHLQWPSVITWFEEILEQQKIPVVLSQRGFHNNVRPFVDKENFKYLQKWYPKIAGFHSVSKAMAANGDKIWNSTTKLNSVIYTGLSLDDFSFSEGYEVTTPLKLLSIGRTHWIKGYSYALQTCSLLKEKNISFSYTIIGVAEDEELQFLINDLELQDCVYLENRLPQPQVFEKMKEASLLLMTSLEEGIPNVVVEAMAIGLPVLSTNCGGIPELITNGNEGWVVPTRNPSAMANAIEAFLNLPVEKIKQVRIAARKKVEAQHSEKEMVNGMMGLYDAVLGVD
ncbi:glycosyltransferase family 4 protein [Rasiella sp. SM2506]|uniref:glycosyltransferase family 4 protein n=1 Tax=Rasiella sp. SM2506 TaxID=3423914 RepID=UPI003D7B13FE